MLHRIPPEDAKELATLSGVDDGLIVRVHQEVISRRLTLVLRCGDLQQGYFDLDLVYEGAEISAADERILAEMARATRNGGFHANDLAQHEIEVKADGRMEHSFLFHDRERPSPRFAVRCRALRWTTTPRLDRVLPEMPDRFGKTDS